MTSGSTSSHFTRATEFSDDYFAMMADLENRHPWTHSMRRLTIELLRRDASTGRILDAGCGTGLFLSDCLKALRGATAVGIDLFPAALRYARTRCQADWLAGSAADLPFRPESFDMVHCADVLQHLTLRHSGRALEAFPHLLLL